MRMTVVRNYRGMSLIELLVVVAIICILAALLMPALGYVNDTRKKAKCASNLRQIGQGVISYAGDHDGVLPIVFDGTAHNGEQFWYNTVAVSLGLDTWAAWQANGLFRCPGCTTPAPNYTMSWALSENNQPLRMQQLSRTSRSVIAADGDGARSAGINASPPFEELDETRHRGGANYLFADGHVEFLKTVPDECLRPQSYNP